MRKKLLQFALASLCGLSAVAQPDGYRNVTDSYIGNPLFSANTTESWVYDPAGSTPGCDWNIVEFYWSQGFDFYQTVTLPAGDYQLIGSAFYRGGSVDNAWAAHNQGNEPKHCFMYAGDERVAVMNLFDGNGPAEGNGWVNPGNGQKFPNWLNEARNYFDLGEYRDNVIDFTVPEGGSSVQLGFRKYSGEYEDQDWMAINGIELWQKVEQIDVDAAEAEKPEGKMSQEAANSLEAALAALKADPTFETLAAYDQACADAKASIEGYAALKQALDSYAAKQATLNKPTAQVEKYPLYLEQYEQGTLADSEVENAIGELKAELLSLIKTQAAPADLTEIVEGAGSTTDGWSCTEGASTWHINSWSGESSSDGTGFDLPFCEYWTWVNGNPNAFLNDATISYSVNGLPIGRYEVSMRVRVMQEADYSYSTKEIEGITLFANGTDEAIATGEALGGPSEGRGYCGTYTVESIVGEDGILTFGLRFASTNASWVIWKNITLQRLEDGQIDIEAAEAEKPEGKMSQEAANSLEAALANLKADPSIETLAAYDQACADAKASIEGYAALKQALDSYAAKQATLIEPSAQVEKYPLYLEQYRKGTVADSEIENAIGELKAELLSLIKTQAAPADLTELVEGAGSTTDGWSCTEGASTWHINSWSHESATDGTDFDTPFCEYWTWVNGNPNAFLNDATISYSVDGLPAGSYEVSMRIRIMQEADYDYSIKEIEGITLFANDADEAITSGEALIGGSEGRGYCGTYTAVGTVGEDGILTFGLRFASTNASWVIWKNITLRHLQDEEPGDPTVIEFVGSDKEETTLYNLAGQKVNANYRGIVINQKGQKILNR